MSHSVFKLWVHCIWTTKNRAPLILPEFEKDIYRFINLQFGNCGCKVRIVNGMPDHVHCLFLLNPAMALSNVMKQAKGSSSNFINENLTREPFLWQIGYAAYSVSESAMNRVFNYIENQKRSPQREKRSRRTG